MRRNVDLRIVNYIKETNPEYDPQLVGRVSNFGSLDLFDNEEIRITFQNQDINDYSKQKISYTKTFNIPATSNNNKLLAFEGLLNNALEPVQTTTTGGTNNVINIFNYPIAVQLWVDDLFIFDGTLLLLSVNKYQNNNSYECIFTTNIYSIIPLLKDQPFNDAYFAKPLNRDLQDLTTPIIPANFIWDSIIFENFNFTGNTVSSQKKQILPSVNSFSAQTGIYPIYNDRSLSGLTNHIITSWEGNAKTHKVFWGYIDDGKITYNKSLFNRPDRINLNNDSLLSTQFNKNSLPIDNSFLLTSRGLNYSGGAQFANNSFNLFETIKPYYYVGDVFRKILRWLEYRLNAEYFDYVFFKPSLTEQQKQLIINFNNYDNPEIGYANIPIKFDFDSDIISRFNQEITTTPTPLDTLILFAPENTEYKNNNLIFNCDFQKSDDAVIFDEVKINFQRIPIINYPSLTGDTPNLNLSWDEYGISFFDYNIKIKNTDFNDDKTITNLTTKLNFNSYEIFNFVISPITLTDLETKTYSGNAWFGLVNYFLLPTYITSNLPPGYNFTNYIDLSTKFLINGNVDTTTKELWKHSYVLYENYIQNRIAINKATNNNINTAYDLRRYLYPSMSDISMGDFIQDIFKLFNVKYEEPNFQSNITNIQLKSYNNYYETLYNKNGVIDLTEKVNIEKIKVKQLLFDNIVFKYGEQSSSLNNYYKNQNKFSLGYGENRVELDTFRKINKDLIIETKLSNCIMKPFIATRNNFDYTNTNIYDKNNLDYIVKSNSPNQIIFIPTLLNFDEFDNIELEFNDDVNIKPFIQFKPFVLFNEYLSQPLIKTTGGLFDCNYTFRVFNKESDEIIYKQSGDVSGKFPILTTRYNDFVNNEFYELNADYRTSTYSKTNSGTTEQIKYKFTPQYQPLFGDNSLNNNRLIELEVDFKLTDIINFSFGQIYSLRLNGEYNLYVINKISDYVLNNTKLAKVELLQISNPSTYLRTETI